MADNVIDILSIEIESNATKSVDGVKRLSSALNSLANSISKVNSAGINNVSAQLKVMTTATGQASAESDKASKGTKNYSNSLNALVHSTNRASNSSKSLAYYFGKMYANCFLLIRGIKAIGKATESAMDYIEAFNFYDVAINSATAKTTEWQDLGYDSAESYATGFKEGLGNLNEKMTGFSTNTKTGDVIPSSKANLGINLTDLTTYEAEIVSITSSLGLMTQTSYDTAQGLSMLAADMSSLHNIDLKTVMTNFQSGLIGQSRALYKYGIDITNATLSQYALANGVTKSVQEMSQAEKMQLRMLAILDQSKVAWGDLANTINQPANQLRVFTNGIKNLAITIGKLLLPVVSGVLPYLNAMVKALQNLFTWLANIAGVNLDAGNSGIGSSDVFDDIADSADDASDAVTNLGNTLHKQLAGFDELNNMTTSSSSGSGSGGGASIDLSDAISSAMANYEKAWEEAYLNMTDRATQMADTITDAFKRKDYKGIGTYISTGITNALNSINWNTVYSVAKDFGSGFAEFLNGLITPDLFGAVGRTIAGALNTAVYNSLAFSSTLDWNNIGESIASGINNFFTTFDFKALAESLNTWVDGLETAIGEALKDISWTDVLNGLGDFFNNLEIDTVSAIIGTLAISKIGKVTIAKGIKDFVAEQILKLIAPSGKISISKIALSFSGFSLSPLGMGTVGFDTVVFDLIGWLDESITKNFEDSDIGSTILDAIGGAVAGISIGGIAGSAIPGIGTLAGAIIGGIAGALGNIVDWEAVGDAISSGLGSIFSSWDITAGLFSDMAESFKSMTETDNFLEIGGYMLQGILQGFAGAFMAISEPFVDFFNWAWNGICSVFGIHSPAKEMEPLGDFILKGIIEGFTGAFGLFTDAIGVFFNDYVVPMFDVDTWKENIGSIKEAIQSKWDETLTYWGVKDKLSEIKTTYEDIKQKVSDKWDSVKTFWERKPSLKQIVASVDDFLGKVSPKWNAVKTFWNNKPSLKQISVTVSDFFKTISDKWSAVKRWWSNLSLPSIWADIKIPHISVSWIDLGKISIPSLSVKYYAKGGFPTMGEAFVAGEAGAEMVGNINGRTGVASNAEITGIADAVYNTGDAQLEALLEQNRLLRALLEKDTGISTRDIFNAVRSEDKAYRNINGHSALEY